MYTGFYMIWKEREEENDVKIINFVWGVISLTALLKYIENIDSSQLFIEVGIKMCQNIYGK